VTLKALVRSLPIDGFREAKGFIFIIKIKKMHGLQKVILAFLILSHPTTSVVCAQNEFSKSAISIGVVVEDLKESVEFYCDVVGMVEVREFSVNAEKATTMGLSDGEHFDVEVLKLENSEEAAELKLMSFGKKSSHRNQAFIPDENGIRYLTIFVKSMKPLIDRIAKSGTKTLGQTPTMLDAQRQFVLIQDPDGNFLEFIGPQ
jgi:catechol 2,3-dioxygenase-like lactoylglutathione lyase family enzyme